MAQRIAPEGFETSFTAHAAPISERFRVSFDIVVTDPAALWHVAARIALKEPGMTIDDVEDVIGPVEDPLLADCLAMLTAPDAITGTLPLNYAVEPIANPEFAHTRERALRALALRDFMTISSTLTKQ